MSTDLPCEVRIVGPGKVAVLGSADVEYPNMRVVSPPSRMWALNICWYSVCDPPPVRSTTFGVANGRAKTFGSLLAGSSDACFALSDTVSGTANAVAATAESLRTSRRVSVGWSIRGSSPSSSPFGTESRGTGRGRSRPTSRGGSLDQGRTTPPGLGAQPGAQAE